MLELSTTAASAKPKAKSAKAKAREFAALHAKAHAAGMAAGEAAVPAAMIVGTPTSLFGNKIDYSKEIFHVAEGVCGFAWVSFSGATSWGKWAKKAGVAKPDYPKGLMIWVSYFGQSLERKESYARAYSGVLREAGIECWVGSRMD